MTQRIVEVHPDPAALAEAVAVRLLARLRDVQAERGHAGAVLTGGRVAGAVYRAVVADPARDAVDWSRVDLWWGDERFLPAGDPDRNETQAREALLDALPLDPARVHPMPPSDGPDGPDPELAAARYTAELTRAAGAPGLPPFDVLLLGVGEDGHVASVFPEHPVAAESRPVSAVRNSPKPPPVRTTLTLPAINTASQVWLIAAGPDKAGPVAAALAGASGLPAAMVHGTAQTVWLLDAAAAAQVPEHARTAG
ncbi:6-phosphogluconolactonase [Catellatospora methionotrophica]|uniref:6-phosphogluconolactonase n=1 Tax=Catellatospora methionotrophica TaxID=121620 RepID=A0A8J3PCV3_9ACTN|nr:6-phosphogluconolactonase [Catellatospora methionotrophica]GIG12811.1 6-phosphogluconolactonase [Catellatospora methionotrophica]